MANSNSGNDQFFEFQAQLEYSAIYYSTLALRHMQINSENPSAPSPQNSASRMSKKTSPQPNPYLPVITVDVEDYGEQVEGLKKNKSRRKVNFAHPLSVVKIKSPTPIHSLEDLGNVIAACNNSMQDTWENPLQQQISNCVYYSDSSDSDVEAVIAPPNFDVGNTYSSYVPSSGNDVCGAEPTSSRKKKRRKRKKSKDDSMYSLDSSSNAGFNPDDPYAIYAVPLNEGDYEFVSDIRLCTDDDMTKLESDSSSISPIESDEDETVEANKNPHKEDPPNNYEDKEELLKEMKQLYGDMGSERIHQMEEAIEKYFFNQLV